MPLETFPFDPAAGLDAEGQAELIADAFESGDIRYITHALNIAARARGLSTVAREIDLTRMGLTKALSENGDPRLSTLLGVVKALGFQLSAKVV